ncbi:MAG: hypothetical protein R3B53_00610 [Candidatus Paceibacterota bacterium]
MNTLNKIIERGLITIFALCFSFVSLYIPNYFSKPEVVEAGLAGGGATEVTQILNNIELLGVNAWTSISATADTITSAMTSNQWIKDNVLDGIGWSLAKGILSTMTSSIVNWINSGFKGSPTFVQDISNYLLEAGDKAIGQYLEQLGGPMSFICSPFKLDVRLAVAIEYDQVRDVKTAQPASTCSLTGVMRNLEGFVNGTENFVDAGGWDAWFRITSNPSTYTPYGSVLAAKAGANARIINARGEEIKLLDFGDGFLSSKICETVHGAGTSRDNCFVSTPGKVISEALTFQLSTGPRTLIEADEINEIVGALFGQLTKQVITGAAGLLGLSGGTGYTYSGVPLTTQVAASGFTSDPSQLNTLLTEARSREVDLRLLTFVYAPQLEDYSENISNNSGRRASAETALDEITTLQTTTLNNIATLDGLISRFNNIPPPASDEEKGALLQGIANDYFALSKLHTKAEVDSYERYWQGLLR